MKRPGQLKRAPMPRRKVRRRTLLEQDAARRWHRTVMASPYRLLSSTTETALSVVQAHHVIPQQLLRAHAVELELDPAVLLWDWRVGAKVTTRRHSRHHARLEPITRAELLEAAPHVFEFSDRCGLGWWLDRHYPA